MRDILTADQIRANIEQSKQHIAKQNDIIARLTDEMMVAEARSLLTTMEGHLEIEREMLARAEADEAR